MKSSFEGFFVNNTSRDNNEHDDMLAKSRLRDTYTSQSVFRNLEGTFRRVNGKSNPNNFTSHNKDWRTKIITFIQGNYPDDDEVYIKRMHARTRPYKVIVEELFKEGACLLLIKCISRDEG